MAPTHHFRLLEELVYSMEKEVQDLPADARVSKLEAVRQTAARAFACCEQADEEAIDALVQRACEAAFAPTDAKKDKLATLIEE